MEGSTGNYSGASYPPSLYDTSVSSASGGRRHIAAPAHSGYNEREDPQFMWDYHHSQQQRGHPVYSKSPLSMDNSKYRYNRDITAMSDPGGSRLEQNHGHRSHMEYAHSEIASPSSSYYEPQHRAPQPTRHLQEERHRETRPEFSQNRYSPAPPRRNSISPPLEQHSLVQQQVYSRDEEITGRGNFVREGYHGGMYKSSPSYNGRPRDSSSAVNVKELKRQLWNNNEVLKVQDPSPPRYNSNRRMEQSQSPERRRHDSIPPSNNLPRFAQSLSPRRRQYQQPSHIVDESSSQIRKASSTMSDTSYNSRFHSKFIEAAMMAQKRVGENHKAIEENEIEQYQQQQERRHQSFSSQPPNEGDSNQQQNLGGSRYMPASPHGNYTSNQNNNREARRQTTQYHRGNDNYANMSNGRGGGDLRRPPIIPPSPSSSSSPAVTNNERHRGRSMDSPQFRRSDGSTRRIRPPSPSLLDRIRSFDQDYHYDPAYGVSESQDRGYDGVVDRSHVQHVSNDRLRGINYHDNMNNNHGQPVSSGKNMNNHYIVNDENLRRQHQGRFRNGGNNFDGRNGHTSEFSTSVVKRENMHRESHSKHQENRTEGPHGISGEMGDKRMANLVDKLSAVDRANPKSALAQIDSILREESRSSHTQSVENHNEGDKKDKKMQSHDRYPTESNFTEREHEDENGDDDDDESSDVSSITNPTFQQATHKSQNTQNMDSLYIRENDHYIMHKTNQDSNLASFNPSTSSFRRPRPSHLQNYSNDVSRDPNTMSRSERKRQQLEKFPPPSTIKVKDDQAKDENPVQSSADVREMMLQKNMRIDASRAKKTNKLSREEERPRIAKNKPKNKLDDKVVGDKQRLAEKIRSWDELSNQISKSRSQEETKDVRQNIKSFSKPHPWDSDTNVVQTKDTSMDDAMGVEAEISTRAHHYGAYYHERDADAEISVEGSRVPKKIQGNHFENARRNIKGRSNNKNPFSDPSVDSSENDALARAQFPDIPDSDQGDSNDIPNIEVSMKGIPQFNPGHQQERDRDEKKTDGEGSSWVEMPPSTYFPDVNDDFVPITSKISRKSGVASKPSGTGGGKLNVQDEEGLSESRTISRLACKTIALKEPKAKEKKRGFLRAFMEKKKTKATSIGYTASASAGSISAHSTSIESRGVKSASHIQSSSRPTTVESSPKTNFHLLAPPPGVLEAGRNARGRSGQPRSASAPRHRPKSSEKFRSNSLAQKFNRVMQLYDSDET